MAEYNLTKLAQRDLRNIWAYTVREWSVEQAEKYVGGLLACFEGLANDYIVGKPAEHIRPGYRKTLYGKHYIFYRTGINDIIEIIRVLHVLMDIENQL